MDTEQRIEELLDQLQDPKLTVVEITKIERKLKILQHQQ